MTVAGQMFVKDKRLMLPIENLPEHTQLAATSSSVTPSPQPPLLRGLGSGADALMADPRCSPTGYRGLCARLGVLRSALAQRLERETVLAWRGASEGARRYI